MKFDKITKILLGLIAAGLWAVVIILVWPQIQVNTIAKAQKARQSSPQSRPVDYDSLTVHRLNVVNEKGQLQWVIADSSLFPPPIINGKVYRGARSIAPTGAVFYDYHGNEVGGKVYSETKGHHQNTTIFDYQNSDGMGFGIGDNRPKNFAASFFIRDPVPLGADITKRKGGSTNTERVSLQDVNGNAALILRDKQGNDRIKLEVSKNGPASIQVLNADEEVVGQIPSR